MITRRALFLLPALMFAEESPRNRVANAGNMFHAQYTRWADAFNAAPKGTMSMSERAEFQRLPKLWRVVERAWRDWWE